MLQIFYKFVLIFFISFAANAAEYKLNKEKAKAYMHKLDYDVVIGNETAPITVIEYSSLSCPHCSYFNEAVFQKINSEYIETGRVKWIRRDFAIDQSSFKGAVLLRCVPHEKYLKFLKILFYKQSSWAYSSNFLELLENIARLGGLSEQKFKECMVDKKIEENVLRIANDARVMELNYTPAFFVNGEEVKIGDFEQFKRIVDNLPK